MSWKHAALHDEELFTGLSAVATGGSASSSGSKTAVGASASSSQSKAAGHAASSTQSKPKHGDWKKASLKESCTALVPYVAPKTTRSAAEASAHCSPNIYTRILSKKLSDESAGPGDAKSPPRLAATSSGPSSSSRSLGREVAWDDFNRSEKDLLAEALSKASHICFAVMLLVCTMPC